MFTLIILYGGLPSLILLFICYITKSNIYVKWRCYLMTLFNKFICLMTKLNYGIKVVYYGDIPIDYKTLIFGNHPSRLDPILYIMLCLNNSANSLSAYIFSISAYFINILIHLYEFK